MTTDIHKLPVLAYLQKFLADAAIGTAHSTLMEEGESFASIDLKINFFRPVWNSTLRATAQPLHSGRTLTHYRCDIVRDDGKVAATVVSQHCDDLARRNGAGQIARTGCISRKTRGV